ncbi:MAG: SDR family oxidoreductase [Alphaproteobacteria bacterium]|nr:SDR family oxidoreductase [Alphaproteobacteria bacterium]
MSGNRNPFDMNGRVVLVTGAKGQIGQALAKTFSSVGARVATTDMSTGVGADFALDVTDETKVAASFEAIEKALGPIDVLVNNAGTAVFEPFDQRTGDDLDKVFDVNVKGTFFCLREFARRYRPAGEPPRWGAIVNIASFFGVVSPDPRVYVDTARNSSEIYGATKAGIIQMTRYFAVHLASRRVRVNAVSPGGVLNRKLQGEGFIGAYSNRVPMARMAEAREIADAVLFLASDASSYVNGHNLVVDGGLTAW